MNMEDVKIRLKSLGYEVTKEDYVALDFVARKVEQHIKHFCNISEVPNCLNYVAVDMVCGEFLLSKKATGQLKDIQVEQIVKSIRDGDSEVAFVSGDSAETVFNTYLENMMTGGTGNLLAHRRLKW